MGVSQWLARGDRAFASLTAAAAADWQLLELASAALAPRARATRRDYMSIHLATALAGDAPLIGLKIYEAAGGRPPMGPRDITCAFRTFGLSAPRRRRKVATPSS